MKNAIRQHSIVLLAYFALSIFFTYPLILHFSTHLPGYTNADAPLFYWNYWWIKRAILDLQVNPLFCNCIFYPTGTSLSVHNHSLINGIIALPLHYFLNITAIYNTIIILSFVLSGYAVFLLAKNITGEVKPAFVAGLIYAFCPYKFLRLVYGHMTLLNSTPWIAFYVFFLYKMANENKPSLKNALFAGLFALLTAINDYYYACYIIIFTLFFWVYMCFENKDEIFNAQYAKKIIVLVIVFSAGLLPIFLSAFNDLRFTSYSVQQSTLAADVIGYVTPSWMHTVYGKYLNFMYVNYLFGSGMNYFGFIVIFLLIYGIIKFPELIKKHKFWLFSALFFFVLSLGPVLKVFNHKTPLLLPVYVFKWIPVLKGLRDSQRFVILVILCLSIITAVILKKMFENKQKSWFLFSAIIFILIFEYLPIPIPLFKVYTPGIYKEIAKDTEECSVLEIPLGWDIFLTQIGKPSHFFQLWQTTHRKNIINGAISRGSNIVADHFLEMPLLKKIYAFQSGKKCVSKDSKGEILEDINYLRVKYIIVHRPYTNNTNLMEFLLNLPVKKEVMKTGSDLSAIKIFPETSDGNINVVQYKYGWYSREVFDEDRVMHWSSGKMSFVEVDINRPGEYYLVMKMNPFPWDYAQQEARIYINGKYLSKIRLSTGWNEYRIKITKGLLRAGKNQIKFAYKKVASPSEVYGTTDTRSIAVAFEYIHVL